jgi:hypothetical protein
LTKERLGRQSYFPLSIPEELYTIVSNEANDRGITVNRFILKAIEGSIGLSPTLGGDPSVLSTPPKCMHPMVTGRHAYSGYQWVYLSCGHLGDTSRSNIISVSYEEAVEFFRDKSQ